MIKTLLKKQLTEIFKAYFFDMKKNKARSKVSIVLYFMLFVVLMGVMSTVFGSLAFVLSPIIQIGFGWLYFAILGLLAVLFGVFGSVFSTYSGLYLAKDNDLLLSMPIPVRAIVVSRLLGVYIMGLLYSAVAVIPAILLYFITSPVDASAIFGAVLFPILVSLFVLALSCIFGYLVARISVKLKNKSYITVIISIAVFALYYFVYFKANSFLGELVKNVAVYGERIKNKAYIVYMVGKSAEGEGFSLFAVAASVLTILFVTLYVISRSFIKIATSSNVTSRVKFKQKRQGKKSILGALISRELKRFTSSPNYMLNCGLGTVFLLAVGAMALVKGSALKAFIATNLLGFDDLVSVAAVALICIIASMNDIAAPSVSLEGKTLWQIRALPAPTKAVLKSKYSVQILINAVPTLFCIDCLVIVIRPGVITGILMVMLTVAYVIFHALFSLYCGLHKPNLNWTNEIVPIKQGLGVMLAIFGGWGYAIAMGASYLLFVAFVRAEIYMLILLVITSALSAILYRWINRKGVKIFESL